MQAVPNGGPICPAQHGPSCPQQVADAETRLLQPSSAASMSSKPPPPLDVMEKAVMARRNAAEMRLGLHGAEEAPTQ
eukprot:3226226-Prymnesium_polylepis.1